MNRKFSTGPRIARPFLQPVRSAVVAALALAAAAGAQAITLYGITSSNELATIDTANVAGSTRTAITGLDAGDRFVGIDTRPGDNRIYGVTQSNRIYTLDSATGNASFVAALSNNVVDTSLGYGIDFNPVADFAGGASLRLVSSAGSNFAINPNTGAVGNLSGTIANGFTGVSYSNATLQPSSAPGSTSLYYINSSDDTLSVATSDFNAPTINSVGALGIDVLNANGFEVLADGTAYAALNIDDNTSLVTGIYTIDLQSGSATKVGDFNGTLSGLTVSPIPEPTTLALAALGAGFLGFATKRRRQQQQR